MTSEKEVMKCKDCKYNRPIENGLEGICMLGHGTSKQKEGGLPLAYNHFDRPSCWQGVLGPSTEERLAKIEKRLEFLEQTEQVETPEVNKPELLLKIFKLIGETYTQKEIDKAMQLMRDEISKAAGGYHNMPKEDVYWGTSDDLL